MAENMRRFACVFPGQGSQEIGMAGPLMEDPLSADVFREAGETLKIDLVKLIQEGPIEDLTQTENAQPAILTTSFAAWKLLIRAFGMNASPTYVAGHSLGEFTALAAAGSLEFKDAVRLVRRRGLLMKEAVSVGEGTMAALIGANHELVAKIVEMAALNEVLDVANYNTAKQTVISGAVGAIERAMKLAKDHGVKKVARLKVSAPFHSRMMGPVREKFEKELQEYKFMTPFCPVVHNVTAWPNTEPRKIINFLAKQIDSSVRWVESIQFMLEHEVEVFIEVGHGAVLQGLVKSIAGKDFNGEILGFAKSEDLDRIIEILGLPKVEKPKETEDPKDLPGLAVKAVDLPSEFPEVNNISDLDPGDEEDEIETGGEKQE